jgi:hypothetical protein
VHRLQCGLSRSLLILLLFVTLPGAAHALSFDCITGNSTSDCAAGETQLSLSLSDAGNGQVLFTLTNEGSEALSVANIYFDDASSVLEGIASIDGSSGVSFSEGGSPPVLPGGNSPAYSFDPSFRARANNPAPRNGVNPGESLAILFDLAGMTTFADVLAAMADGDTHHANLRVGLHVIAFESGGSESFIVTPIPEPASAVLVTAGLLGLAIRRRAARR